MNRFYLLLVCAAALAQACVAPMEPRNAAAAIASASAARPASKIPNLNVILAWDGTPVTVPAPIDADRVVFNTPQYRQWQFRGSGSEFTMSDSAGFSYQVQTVGKSTSLKSVPTLREQPGGKKKKSKAKKARTETVSGHGIKLVVARHRPDGTLDNVTTYRADGSLDGWIAYSPDGQARQVRVQMRATAECPPGTALIHSVFFYEPEQIRQLLVNAQGVAWREALVTETGAIRKILREDPKQADVLRKLGEMPKAK